MSEYEDQIIREATEGPSFQEVHEAYLEPEPEQLQQQGRHNDKSRHDKRNQ